MNIPKFVYFYYELCVKRKARGLKEYKDYMEDIKIKFCVKDDTFYFLPWEMTKEECMNIARMYHQELAVERTIHDFPELSYLEVLKEHDLA